MGVVPVATGNDSSRGAAVGISVIDLVVVLLALGFAANGYRQGFVTSVLSFVGFFGGAVLGAQLATPVAERVADGTGQVVVAVAVVLVLAFGGQVLAVWLGAQLRNQMTWRPARTVDSAFGAAVSVLTVLLVAWMVATPLASSSYPGLASAVRRSEVVRAVNKTMPGSVRNLYESLRDLVDRGAFPEVFGPLVPTHVRPVGPPDQKLLNSLAVRSAHPSVVKVTGVAPSCSRRIEGSGFVYAARHVLTNAHVVAGVRAPRVEVDGGDELDAQVVLYDPERDVAVLYVPGLRERPLRFASDPADSDDDAIILGYPEDGPFFVTAARVRDREQIRGPDIYNKHTVSRDVYTLRGSVRSGNSGGPLIAPNGTVYGMVFAAALDDPDTGFALTADEVSADARRGAHATTEVTTGACD